MRRHQDNRGESLLASGEVFDLALLPHARHRALSAAPNAACTVRLGTRNKRLALRSSSFQPFGLYRRPASPCLFPAAAASGCHRQATISAAKPARCGVSGGHSLTVKRRQPEPASDKQFSVKRHPSTAALASVEGRGIKRREVSRRVYGRVQTERVKVRGEASPAKETETRSSSATRPKQFS